jgi:serine beta-lactamase-like protein LACTB
MSKQIKPISRMSKQIKLISCVALVGLVYSVWPVYQYFAHKGKVPMWPLGKITIPLESPSTQKLFEHTYKVAGDNTINLLKAHKKEINAPAISAAVAIDGQLVWAGATGWADIENKTPVSTNTQFRIGSTSKALTATALARLVDAGVIDLDKSIDNYIKSLPNPQWKTITPRQLASHMAGLPGYKQVKEKTGLYHIAALDKHYDNVNNALELFDDTPLLTNPGEKFSYTSLGTVLLSAAMSGATQKPYLTTMRKQVFEPLNLLLTEADKDDSQGEKAAFYWHFPGDKAQVKVWRDVDLSHRLAGGGLISTSSELVKIGSAWLDESFISKETRKRFWQPQQLTNGKINEQNYALGWRYTEKSERLPAYIHHGGVSRGAQSWLMIMPQIKMVIALNINAKTKAFRDFSKISKAIEQQFSSIVTVTARLR